MKCWILEINDHPSFNILVCKEPKGSDCTHETCPISKTDLHVKKRVMTDTINLVINSRKESLSTVGEEFGCLERLYPFQDQDK